jgi:DNA-binding protein WhiA
VYGYPSEVHVLASGGLRKASHYIVRVVKDGEALARQTGLLTCAGRPVRGLPPHVVSANMCCAVAAWRGAFLAHGSLTEPGRSCASGDHLSGAGGGARPGRRGPPAPDHRQGP